MGADDRSQIADTGDTAIPRCRGRVAIRSAPVAASRACRQSAGPGMPAIGRACWQSAGRQRHRGAWLLSSCGVWSAQRYRGSRVNDGGSGPGPDSASLRFDPGSPTAIQDRRRRSWIGSESHGRGGRNRIRVTDPVPRRLGFGPDSIRVTRDSEAGAQGANGCCCRLPTKDDHCLRSRDSLGSGRKRGASRRFQRTLWGFLILSKP